MNWESLATVLIIWLVCQLCALTMLQLGSKFIENNTLLRLGNLAHKQKIKALESYWPLNKIRPALANNNTALCQIILTSLIALKSLLSFVFGALMVFWLPLAAFLVPSIITIHQPGNIELISKVNRIARWQVTSHTLAAAIGAYVFYCWWADGVIEANLVPELLFYSINVLACSFVCAWIAGKLETKLISTLEI
jgi:hypothetical protein